MRQRPWRLDRREVINQGTVGSSILPARPSETAIFLIKLRIGSRQELMAPWREIGPPPSSREAFAASFIPRPAQSARCVYFPGRFPDQKPRAPCNRRPGERSSIQTELDLNRVYDRLERPDCPCHGGDGHSRSSGHTLKFGIF